MDSLVFFLGWRSPFFLFLSSYLEPRPFQPTISLVLPRIFLMTFFDEFLYRALRCPTPSFRSSPFRVCFSTSYYVTISLSPSGTRHLFLFCLYMMGENKDTFMTCSLSLKHFFLMKGFQALSFIVSCQRRAFWAYYGVRFSLVLFSFLFMPIWFPLAGVMIYIFLLNSFGLQ